MSALELSSNLGGTKSPVSILLPSLHVTPVIAAGCNITHTLHSLMVFYHCRVNRLYGQKVRLGQNEAIMLQGTEKRMICYVESSYKLPATTTPISRKDVTLPENFINT